jgi:amino acid adenylation domain-containing protein
MPHIVLVGEGALAVRCLELLEQRGKRPDLIASFDLSLVPKAEALGIPHEAERAALRDLLEREGCDYLFSIRNPWVVPESVLAHVRKHAINFHDAPLPKYAGLHATSWALIQGETEHGVSFHEMSADLDAGAIFKQVRLPVSSEDTAFTLNTRCFDAAVQAFEELTLDLTKGELVKTPQVGERSYFAGRMRPPAACVLDFAQEARTLVNLVRGLDFGPAKNPLGLAKLWTGERVLWVKAARLVNDAAQGEPGMVLGVRERSLIVAACDGAIALECSTLKGQTLEAEELEKLVGHSLPALPAGARAQLTQLHGEVCQGEGKFVERLRGVRPIVHPYAVRSAGRERRVHALPRFQAALHEQAQVDGKRAFAIVCAYLTRVAREGAADVALTVDRTHGLPPGFFADELPLRLSSDPTQSFLLFEQSLNEQLKVLRKARTYTLDLPLRAPELRPELESDHPLAIALTLSDDAPKVHAASLTFWLSPGGNTPRLLAPPEQPYWQVEAIDRQLAAVTHAVSVSPEQSLARLPLLDREERDRMLVSWNATERAVPDVCVHTLVEEQVSRTPDAPAVRFADQRLSYAELDARANRIARALIARGVQPGELVALCVARSVDSVAGMLGILKAGAAYVPIDPSYPRERVDAMLRASAAQVVVTQRALTHTLLSKTSQVLCVDDPAVLAAFGSDAPQVEVNPSELVYVIFTSGSTGEPKGVEIRHRSLVNHSLAIAQNYGLGSQDRMLCSASISFDVAAEQIYPALFSGAEVIVRPDDLLESFERFDRFARELAITAMILPTAFWHEWVRELEQHAREVPEALRVLSVGTEKALNEHLSIFQHLSRGRVRFFQGYGPTETTVTCTMYTHQGGEVDASAPLPIGRPLPNTEIYILDEQLEPVPVGMEGELYVGGMGVARGYLGRPDLTRERFLPHPFERSGDARIYKTGDLARYQPDGQIVYVGRADFQVKVRGFRVELGEIEALLCKHPRVDECVVLLREDTPGMKRLVAYVLAKGGDLQASELEALTRAHLPEYMVPSAFVSLEAFPMTPNRKVDRKALPPPSPARSEQAVAPSDDVELVVSSVWSEVLKVTGFGVDDDFFELGGDSLRALRVLERLNALGSHKLSLSDLFSERTVRALAVRLRSGGGVEAPAVIRIKDGKRGAPLFMVCGIHLYQAFAQSLDTDHPVYAMYLPVEQTLLQDGAELPPVEELASSYLRVLQKHTPEGPYVLGGVSFGGAVAYEMARQLRAQDEHVELLVLLDAILPRARQRGALPWLKLQAQAVSRNGAGVLVDKLKNRLLRMIDRAAPRGPNEALELNALDMMRQGAYARALAEYDQRAAPYEGHAILFRALHSQEGMVDRDHGWARLVQGDFAIHDVPGDHLGLLTPPHVHTLTRELARRLSSR